MAVAPLITTSKGVKLPFNTPFGFQSLSACLSDITASLTGVPGVYMLINNNDTSRYYIGSSVNLGRRLTEYRNIMTGTRLPISVSETELAATTADQ
jgi:hypothetical protein